MANKELLMGVLGGSISSIGLNMAVKAKKDKNENKKVVGGLMFLVGLFIIGTNLKVKI